MNYKMIFKMLGRVSGIEAALMVIPMLVALGYGESIKGFAVGIGVAVAVCLIFAIATRRCNGKIFSKEGLTSVALCWVLISLVGAIPFTVDGAIPNYIDAVFETVSGFTTTGSSILTDVEALGKGMLFWRSFTHWIGGMGILVFMMRLCRCPRNIRCILCVRRCRDPRRASSPRKSSARRLFYILSMCSLPWLK